MINPIKAGDLLLFRSAKKAIDAQAVQMAVDGATHIEVVCYPKDGANVVSLGSDKPDGLAFRERLIGTDNAVVRITAHSPFSEETLQDIMMAFFNWRTKNYDTAYGDKNLISGIFNEALDSITGGGWTKRPIENYSTRIDCSATAAMLTRIFFPGFEFQRKDQADLIDPRCVTPGDVLFCQHSEIIKEFGAWSPRQPDVIPPSQRLSADT